MARAAVPSYVDKTFFSECPPGHRFNLYFEAWDDNWSLEKNSKAKALSQALSFAAVSPLLSGLRRRQNQLARALLEANRFVIDAKSTSPFATGLGLEHPVENGFAFLTPYGVPYLAGSGVKVHVTPEDLAAIPANERGDYLLQEKVAYAPAIATLDEPSKVEVRIMYVWPQDAAEPMAVTTLTRMSKGAMMGVDFNKNKSWVGSSCSFFEA